MPEDIRNIRILVKSGRSKSSVAKEYRVSGFIIRYWCWTKEQRKEFYLRGRERLLERGYALPTKEQTRAYRKRKLYLFPKEMPKYKVRESAYYDIKSKGERSKLLREKRLKKAVMLWRKIGKRKMNKLYKNSPSFLSKVEKMIVTQ
ncbi:MAG TPA: hypothetical protein ENI13_00100 [candidate division CPR3 bacterium]|uniref:Uncharacterized protein n=1 Tax=candidate division CPR3 bacterium TaxID=2268181 RepID=A0A7C1NM62_UNCC3|nr:hypothetical protein [candidate division CPR3 bacterium]